MIRQVGPCAPGPVEVEVDRTLDDLDALLDVVMEMSHVLGFVVEVWP